MRIGKVLIVDDDEDIRFIGALCASEVGGWEVIVAASGAEALEKAATEEPDVILLDVMMPEMDGPTVLRRLREQETSARIPVIFLTAKVQPQEIDGYLSLGAAGVIRKPFDPMQLPDEIRRILGGSGPR